MGVEWRRSDKERPPGLVVLAAVAAFVGCIPGVFVAFAGSLAVSFSFVTLWRLPFTSGGLDDDLLTAVLRFGAVLQGGLLAVGVPVLLTMGAVRLLLRRDRWMLFLAGLPVTAVTAWQLLDPPVLGPGEAGTLLVIGPALAPLVALAPSVGRWVDTGRTPEIARSRF
jgi:hypothetical protein